MRPPLDLNGKVAVVTGAGSGIGQALAVALAVALAGRGARLALADVNPAGLEATAARLPAGAPVSLHPLDVADAAAVAAFPEAVLAAHGQVDVLVNNAGVALGGTFEQVSAEEFDWLVGFNFHGVVRMTRAFLPHLKARPQAQLVNLSSLFGLIAPPGQAAYAASKFAVRGFSNALRHELDAEGSSVGVTVVHPGGVRTAIARNARRAAALGNAPDRTADFERLLRLPPERAAQIILKAVERRKARVLVGGDAVLMALMERLAPVSYWKLMGPRIR